LVAGDEFFEMGRYLVLGSGLAAALQTFIPQARLLELGSGPLLSVLVMIGLAVLAFLVYGPMVDLKSILMFRQVFKRRAVVYLILLPLTVIGAFGLLWLAQVRLANLQSPPEEAHDHHGSSPSAWDLVALVLPIVLGLVTNA
jgi:uncharacterized membrane protein YraQ (UPF0718 family)